MSVTTSPSASALSPLSPPSPLPTTTPVRVASLSGWANGRPLEEVLARMDADPSLNDVAVVELAIGARPVADPLGVLRRYRHRFSYIAHHSVTIAPGRVVRPDAGDLVAVLDAAQIHAYSAHPPSRSAVDDDGLWRWALELRARLADAGISFALETMYPVRDRADAAWGTSWHLDSPVAVHGFLDRAAAVGWDRPLVLDAAHLHIGRSAGVWDDDAIATLCQRLADTRACAEAHISTNDGVRDRHDPPGTYPELDEWARRVAYAAEPGYLVDEGRRR